MFTTGNSRHLSCQAPPRLSLQVVWMNCFLLISEHGLWMLTSHLPPPIGPLLVSLKPGSGPVNSLLQLPESEPPVKSPDLNKSQGGRMPPEEMQKKSEIKDSRNLLKAEERLPKNEHMRLSNGFDVFECPPPKTENEVWRCRVKGWGCGGYPVSWQKDAVHKVMESREGLFCRVWKSVRSLWQVRSLLAAQGHFWACAGCLHLGTLEGFHSP